MKRRQLLKKFSKGKSGASASFLCDEKPDAVFSKVSEANENICKSIVQKEKEKKNLENLQKLIEAEQFDAKDIPEIFLKKPKSFYNVKCEFFRRGNNFKETVRNNISSFSKMAECEREIHPEVAAAMLHSEEKGSGLSKTPREIYDALFPPEKIIQITKASAKTATDVLPTFSKKISAKEMDIKEDAAMLDFTTYEEKKFSLPEANLREIEEEEDDNLDDVLGVVDSQVFNDEAATFKVILRPNQNATNSQVQMRGSQPPSWFPGYFVIMPEHEDLIPIEQPWTILEKAWQNFCPTNVKPKKGPLVIGN